MKGLILVLLVSFAFLFAGCTSQAPQQSGKMNVVVTTFFLQQFAEGVGGDNVAVSNLLPNGANPHSYEPTPADIARAHSAKVFLYNGAGLEPYVSGLVASLPSSVKSVETSNGIVLMENEEHNHGVEEHHEEEGEHDAAHHDHGLYNPHIWLDPVLAKQQVDSIANAFSEADPANAEYYRQNADAYNVKLDALDAKAKSTVAGFSKKEYIGFHPSFTYFNKRYGLEYAAVIEEFAGDEPSAQEMANIVAIAKAEGIGTIFAEPFLDPRAAEAIAKETGGQVLYLDPMPTASQLSSGKDYFAIMEYNLEQLQKALQ